MAVELQNPWLLLCLPAGAAFVWLVMRGLPLSRRLRVARALRLAALCLLTLAISGLDIVSYTARGGVYIVADLSGSARAQRGYAQDFIAQALLKRPSDMHAGVVGFGREARVETPLSEKPAFAGFETDPGEGQTNIEKALGLAGALFPADRSPRMLLISDGRENVGDAARAAASLGARGVPIDVLALSQDETLRDAQVTQVNLPDALYEGEAFDLTVVVHSTHATTAKLTLHMDRQPLGERDVHLVRGENRFVFRNVAKSAGVVRYEVQLTAEGDSVPQNNAMSVAAPVMGAPEVLLVEGLPGEARELSKMLAAAGMNAQTVAPTGMPSEIAELRRYDAVALLNVNDADLEEAHIAALQSFVQELGRGLFVSGGDNSFAPGGYLNGKIEPLLPVSMDVKGRTDTPTLSLIMVLDKSGSMSDTSSGVSLLDMAKEAAARSTLVLTERDSVGVIAFDDMAKWVWPLAQMTDAREVRDAVGSIVLGGGTSYFAAIQQARQALEPQKTALKHVIFLSDGAPGDSGFESEVVQMQRAGITFTTVAVGGADANLLKGLSVMGGGRYYRVKEPRDIPKIFAKETYLSSGNYIRNRTFTPAFLGDHPATRDFAALPPLDGYLATTLKTAATNMLVSDLDEPVLAEWNYGLGRVMCWTSDLRGRWTADYIGWAEAQKFFAGLISRVLPEGAQGAGRLTASAADGVATVRVQTQGGEEASVSANVIAPDGTSRQVILSAVRPGEYEAQLSAEQQGAYVVTAQLSRGEESLGSLEGGLSVPYSPEYDLRQYESAALLASVAQSTGGRMIGSPDEVFSQPPQRVEARTRLWPLLLSLALAVFVLDVAARRLPWEAVYDALALRAATAWETVRRKRITRAGARRRAVAPVGDRAPEQEKPSDPPTRSEAPAQASAPPESAQTAASKLLEAQKNRKRKL